jgi:hypothetical protein
VLLMSPWQGIAGLPVIEFYPVILGQESGGRRTRHTCPGPEGILYQLSTLGSQASSQCVL